MSQQIQISGGAKVRALEGVITGTSGVLSSVPLGAANGVATLDSGGKVPVSQLPSSVVTYLGTWNAATNTPTLVNGTGDAGDMYICNVAGTVNFGAGPVVFVVGDWVLYGSGTWQKSSGQNGTVTSVGLSTNGGAITIGSSPVTTSGTISFNFNGTNLQYVNGAGNLTTFPTLITSIGLSMPSAFSVANSPLTANGTIAVTGAGTTAQYIRGDGSLATFPTIATEAQRLITEVYNETGATLTKGTVVYINGGHGNLPTITKALATGDATSAQTYGIVQTDITDMSNGYVVVIGSLGDLDTQAYANGTQLYLSSTTAGAWTDVKQYAPAHLVYVGIVVRSHPTQGVVEVRIQNGFEMDELHNVSAQTPLNNQGLFYNTSTSLWENKSIATALGYTPANDALVVHLAGTETITGSKTFSSTALFDTTTLYKKIGSPYITSAGYTSLQFTASGTNTSLYITDGDSVTSNRLIFKNNAGYDYTFPAVTGTLAMLEGTQTFSGSKTFTNVIKGDSGVLIKNGVSPTSSGYTGIGAGTSGINVSLGAGGGGSLIFQSTSYNYTFPSATGTIALTSDLTGYVTSVTGTSPIVSSGGTTPDISIPVATSSANGYLSSTDWLTFNGKIGGGGTTNYIPKFSGTFSIADSIIYDNSGNVLINTTDSSIGHRLAVYSATEAAQLRVMGLAPSVLFTESTTNTNSYSAYLGVVTSVNNFYTGSFIGDFVMSNNSNYGIAFAINNSQKLRIANTGAATFASSVTATSFVKTSGTSAQFLKADGSVDSSTYLTTSAAASTYLPLAGGTLTGALGGTSATFSSSVTANGITNGDGTADTRIVTRPNTPYALGLQNSTTSNIYYLGVTSSAATADFQIYNTYSAAKIFSMNYLGAATFTSTLLLNSASSPSAGFILFNYASNANSRSWKVSNDQVDWGDFAIQQSTTQTGSTYATKLLINASGAATFSSSVTATQLNASISTSGAVGSVPNLAYFKNQGSGYVARMAIGDGTTSDSYISHTGGNTTATQYLGFGVNAYNQMVLTGAGNVGIGTASPVSKLQVEGETRIIYTKAVAANPLDVSSFSGLITVNTNNINGSLSGIAMYANSDYNAAAGIFASRTSGTSADLVFYAGSATAGERMRITSGGNVLIGTTTDEGYKLYVNGGSSSGMLFYSTSAANQIKAAGTAPAITFSNTITSPTIGGVLGAATGANQFITGTASGDMVLANQFNTGALIFGTNNTQRMRISTGGIILMNLTTDPGAETLQIQSTISGGSQYGILIQGNPASYGQYAMRFLYPGVAVVGSITFNTTSTAYNTSSDYRLKEDFKDFNALDIISKIKFYDFKWKSEDSRMIGVKAHELKDIVPYAVNGEKDAIDEKGNPNYQGVDYSKLVAIQGKAIQELKQEIEELKLKIK